MNQRIYAIKDDVTGFNSPLTIFANDQEALRVFLGEVENPESMLNKWQKDFSLWLVGERDTVTGRLVELEPELIMRAENYVKRSESDSKGSTNDLEGK